MKPFIRLSALGVFAVILASAQDITGYWQGTFKAGPEELRTILRIAKSDSGGWEATLFRTDQRPDPGIGMSTNSFSLDDSNISFTIDELRGSFEGKFSPDAESISGVWTQLQPLLLEPLELQRANKETAWADSSPHSVQFIAVDNDVELEVLNWGGSGRPIVLLAGLGNSAHAFDSFAPKLTAAYRVLGVTRRAFGFSSAPSPVGKSAYSSDRLGDDVLEVLDALELDEPVLVGHSFGGAELSSLGSRHPERVAGLIYLDAGYSYAFYDSSVGTTFGRRPERSPIEVAILNGTQKYTKLPVPALAIYALPDAPGQLLPSDSMLQNNAAFAAARAQLHAMTRAQAAAFERGVPSARVVVLPHAKHAVFESNEADVLREMNAFLNTLP